MLITLMVSHSVYHFFDKPSPRMLHHVSFPINFLQLIPVALVFYFNVRKMEDDSWMFESLIILSSGLSEMILCCLSDRAPYIL